jgi:hypothetical protein
MATIVVDLWLKAGQDSEGLSVAFKPTYLSSPKVQCRFTVVPKRRMTKIMSQATHVD